MGISNTSENSEGRPMNIFERDLIQAGYKVLIPADIDNEGFTVLSILAEVHPDSIPFVEDEIKKILSLYSMDHESKNIMVKSSQSNNEGTVLNVGFRIDPVNFKFTKDYIKEFNEAQKDKKLFLPADWDEPSKFTPSIKSTNSGELKFSPNDIKKIRLSVKPEDNSQSFPMETISLNEVKNMVSEAILDYMNSDIKPFALLSEQKIEIKQKIEEGCKRQGIMSISFNDDVIKDEATVNLLIDPTNRNNWIMLKQEQIYKVPYAYKNALHEYASEIWKNTWKNNIK